MSTGSLMRCGQTGNEKVKGHVLFLSYHLPLPSEPGAFRPWMEARLLAGAGYRITVITSGVQYMTGKDIRPGRGWCTEETVESIRILRAWAPANHRGSVFRRTLNYLCYSMLAGLAAILKVGKLDRVLAGTDPIFMMPTIYLVIGFNLPGSSKWHWIEIAAKRAFPARSKQPWRWLD